MTTPALRDHLIALIRNEQDEHLLQLMRSLLEKDDPKWSERRMIMEGILRSEQDIVGGRTFSASEAKRVAKAALKRKS